MGILKREQAIAASTYPLDLEGPLCPLLNDGDLLLRLYEESGAKQEIKKYIKRNRWEGKPPLSYSMSPDALKKSLLSLHNSARARRALESGAQRGGDSLVLYQVIWNWLMVRDPALVESANEHSHSVGDRLYISPKELHSLIAARRREEGWKESGQRHLAYLVLGFAMLQPDDRTELVRTFVADVPELATEMGVE